MEKTIAMKIDETKNNLVEICNESQLHPSILQLIIQNLYSEVNLLSEKTLENDKKIYEEASLSHTSVKEQ